MKWIETVFKWIDIPPVWTLGHMWAAWLIARAAGPVLPGWAPIGAVLMVAGLALMLAAVIEMRRARTTVLPHMWPSYLVTTGIFRFTRNPIYLGDMLLFVGWCFWIAGPVGLILVIDLIWVLHSRFIVPEEQRLHTTFGDAFATYANKTRRWI